MLRLWIQERAAARGISMMKLSHRSEVSYSLLRDLFADPYHTVTLRTLERIASALDVPATSLLMEVSEQAAGESEHAVIREESPGYIFSRKKDAGSLLRLRILEVAKEKKFSLTKLSHRSEISYNTVKEMCRNPYHNASTDTLNRLASVLEVPTIVLLEDISSTHALLEQTELASRKNTTHEKDEKLRENS